MGRTTQGDPPFLSRHVGGYMLLVCLTNVLLMVFITWSRWCLLGFLSKVTIFPFPNSPHQEPVTESPLRGRKVKLHPKEGVLENLETFIKTTTVINNYFRGDTSRLSKYSVFP